MPNRLALIAAVANNRVIGRDNALPWRLPEDLQHFKALTLGHAIIMGRKTWESLRRPLPGRTNIVISRQPDYFASGAQVVPSLAAALAVAQESDEDGETFVIGGAEIYQLALPRAQRLYLTEVDVEARGDTLFPLWDKAAWRETGRQAGSGTAEYRYDFVTYERQR